MISLWTSNPESQVELRSLFKFNRFDLSAPPATDTEDILSVLEPVDGQPDRMSLFGISTHLSEALQPYLSSLDALSPAHSVSGEGSRNSNYDTAYAYLSQLPSAQRQIVRPEFIRSHHGFLCLGGSALMERLALSLHKRLGKPAFIVTPMPTAKTYGLEYRFSPGLYDLSRLMEMPPIQAREDWPVGLEDAHQVTLILNTDDMDLLRASSGAAYIHKLRGLLHALAGQNISELQIIWQSTPGENSQIQRQNFQRFMKQVAPHLQTRWTMQLKGLSPGSDLAIFALSSFSGLGLAKTTQRAVYVLQSGPFDGLGGTRVWDKTRSPIPASPALTPTELKQQRHALRRLKTHYSFSNAIASRARFKSVVQEVVVSGVPKL